MPGANQLDFRMDHNTLRRKCVSMEALNKKITTKFEAVGSVLDMAIKLLQSRDAQKKKPITETKDLKNSKGEQDLKNSKGEQELKESKRVKDNSMNIQHLQDLELKLASNKLRYTLTIGSLFLGVAIGRDAEKISAREEFARVVSSEGFESLLTDIVSNAVKILVSENFDLNETPASKSHGKTAKSLKPPDDAIVNKTLMTLKKLLGGVSLDSSHNYDKESIMKASSINFFRCDCGVTMTVDPEQSTLRCHGCSALRDLDGTVFEDTQFYSQEGQKAKSGTFNPNRHFHYWWTHIFALENEDELGDPNDPDNVNGEKVLVEIREIVKREKKILQMLTISDMRAILRQIRKTELNKNSALLLKKITGRGPPAISEEIKHKAEKIFTKAIEIGERKQRLGRTNRNYYPFYILKILDAIVPKTDKESRRALFYIYLQSEETVYKDDEDWRVICSDPEMSEIQYVPTDRWKAITDHCPQ